MIAHIYENCTENRPPVKIDFSKIFCYKVPFVHYHNNNMTSYELTLDANETRALESKLHDYCRCSAVA